MIIDIETVVFRDPVVQIGHMPVKLITRATSGDDWLIQLDVENAVVTLCPSKGEDICVPVANVLCYTRTKDAAPALAAPTKAKAAGGKR